MAPRPNWKGFLKLSLVSCAVALYPATTTTERVRFHIINRKTGHRIRNEVVDAETGQPVEPDERVKGYEFAKGEYLLLEDDELDNVALESTHTIDIGEFVPVEEIDRIYLDESFYLVPQDEVAQDAFTLIREAMRKANLAGLARVVIYRREHLLLLVPRGKGLMATALRYKTEVRDEKDYFDAIPDTRVPADMLKLATQVLENKRGHFDPNKFNDRYEDALNALIAAKRAGKKPPVVSAPAPSNVIDLMDALRRSAKGRPARAPARKTGSPKRNVRRKVKKAG
jgi:DNA end-binding protein Ku